MPKYLYGKIVIRTYEVYAETPEQAKDYIKKWEEGDSEEPESGIKATSYKLFWDEFNENPTEKRNHVLAAFLNLMQNVIPGIPKVEKPRIIVPTGISIVEEPLPPEKL
jgi:hypothetical protein